MFNSEKRTFVYFKAHLIKSLWNKNEYLNVHERNMFVGDIRPDLPLSFFLIFRKWNTCLLHTVYIITGLQCIKAKRKRSFRRISKVPLFFAIIYTDWIFTYTLQGKYLDLKLTYKKYVLTKSFFCYCTFTEETYYRQFGKCARFPIFRI